MIDCYLREAESKLKFYREMCGAYSAITEEKLTTLQEGFVLDGFDAVVISGSQWMISEDEPDNKIKAFIRSIKIPTLGICFGHQLLARSFGAEVRNGGEVINRDERIFICEPWGLFFGLGDDVVNGIPHSVVMRENHQEFVTPESIRKIGWLIGAYSLSCPVEAICHPTLPLYGVQFHPERSGENGEKIFRNFYRLVVNC